jgi:antitoxin MazE
LSKPEKGCIFFVDTKEIAMQTRIQKWGNSLALRIPKTFAIEAQLEEDAVVDIALIEGQIVIKPIAAHVWTLEELLAGVTPNNIHRESETGANVGKELW